MCDDVVNRSPIRVEDNRPIGLQGSMLDPVLMAALMQICARSDPSSEPLSTESATMVGKPISSRRPLTKLKWVELMRARHYLAH